MRKLDTARAWLVHLFALDRNELRRRSDLIEAWFLLALVVAFVPLAAVAAITAASWVHADGTRALGGGRLTEVTAVLTRNAPAEDTLGSSPRRLPGRETTRLSP